MDSQPLHILHVIEPGGGGTLRHVIDLAGAQVTAGHRVTIVYSPLRLETDYAAQLQQLPNVTLHSLPIRRAPHPSDILNILKLARILKSARPDIMHGHSTKAGMLVRLVRPFTQAKIIYTPHAMLTLDPEMPRLKKWIYGLYERVLSPLMHRMIVLSNQEFQQAVEFGIAPRKLAMGLNGIQAFQIGDRAALRRTFGMQDQYVVIGFVGRLERQKNPQLALQAFAKAFADNPNLRLLMIGDGTLRRECETLARNLNIDAYVTWLGMVNARQYYGAMDILLATSRYDVMAYIFAEALHAGIPVVTTPVVDSSVKHGETGLIIPPDANTLAQGINQISTNPTLRADMQTAAKRFAENFTIAHMLDITLQIYRSVIE